MTEEQTPSEDSAVDAQRQAEIEALAAQLASAAAGEPVAGAPRKRGSRRVIAKDPAEFVPTEQPATAAEDVPVEESPVEAPAPEPVPAETEAPAEPSEEPEGEPSEGGEDESAEPGDGEHRSGRSRRGRSRNRNGNGAQAEPQPQQQPQQQSGRNRNRGRDRFGDDVEPEILEDDVLIPIAGILDVLDNYAFVRTTGYLPGPTDVYVSLGQVKKYGLRKGDAVVGAIRQPREGEQPGRQKYNALVKVDSVNGQTGEQSIARPEFAGYTPVRPSEPLGLGGAAADFAKGQRALVLGPTGSGKTAFVAAAAEAATSAQPESHLMVILVGARPEEVTEFRRSVKGEVVVAGLEQGAEETVTVVELAVERAKRLVELGIDVIVLIDSITQLGRSVAALAPRASVEDPAILLPLKRLFAGARALEEAAALTIVATGSEETAIDRLAVTELRSIANAVARLG